ncbi:hypothetical protein [Actinomadura sp. NPDC000600]|uniref:hypothetical protein n=1 Tax=Actinomadura sp. NPDC000600 TaxID=3154262 RepID=UPI003392392B
MRDHEPGRLDPRAAERLLDGAGGHPELRELLAAAAAPGRPEELAGEDAAVAAFLAAPRTARASRTARLRRFLTAKVIAVVGGSILLSGGVAYATGNFPGQGPAPAPSPTPREHKGREQGGAPGSRTSQRPGTAPSSKPSQEPGKSGEHGKTTAPGQQRKTETPKAKPTTPRGPGNNNATTRPSIPAKKSKSGSQGNGAANSGTSDGTVPSDGATTGTPLLSGGNSRR